MVLPKLVNYYYDESLSANVPVFEVVGQDNGISHSFVLSQDAFATGDVSLVNNKQYYYLAVHTIQQLPCNMNRAPMDI